MTNAEKQRWSEERAKGRDNFLLRAIVWWGLPFGIVMMIFSALFRYLRDQSLPSLEELFANFGAASLLFGAIRGWVTWSHNEEDFNKPTEDEDVT